MVLRGELLGHALDKWPPSVHEAAVQPMHNTSGAPNSVRPTAAPTVRGHALARTKGFGNTEPTRLMVPAQSSYTGTAGCAGWTLFDLTVWAGLGQLPYFCEKFGIVSDTTDPNSGKH